MFYINNKRGLRTLNKLHKTGKLGKLSRKNFKPYIDIIENALTGISPQHKKYREIKNGGKRKTNKKLKSKLI